MELKNIPDFLFMMVGTFTIVTGLIIVIEFLNDSLTYDKCLYTVSVFIIYFLLILIRARQKKKNSKDKN